ncbi:MAG: DUF5723 family protein [Bacteroidota bacterium]
MKKLYIFACLISFLGLMSDPALAQRDQSLYLMPGVFQRIETNPAFLSRNRINIVLPAPSFSLSHSGFVLSDVLVEKPGTDSLQLDMNGVLAKLKAQNFVRARMQSELLGVGLRLGNLQLSLKASTRASFYGRYPRELIDLAWNGNAQFIGQTVNVQPDFEALAYHELAVGGAYRLGKLQIGAQLKYLIGMAQIETFQSNLSLTTGAEYYQLRADVDAGLRASVFDLGSVDDLGFEYEADPLTGNQGFALDLGAVYQINDRLEVSASLLDLGSIKWTDQARQYQAEGSIAFEGFDLQEVTAADFDFGEWGDSVLNEIELTESNLAYRTPLARQVFVSATFRPIQSLRLSLLHHSEFYRGQHLKTLTLAASKDVGKWLTGGLSYGLRSQGHVLGANLSIKLGPFLWYAASDHILAPLDVMNARQFNLRFGMNLAIGKIK